MPTYYTDIGPVENAFAWDTDDVETGTYEDGDPWIGLRTNSTIEIAGAVFTGTDPIVMENNVGIKWKTVANATRTMLKFNSNDKFIIGNDDATDGADAIIFHLQNLTDFATLDANGFTIPVGYMSADRFISDVATGTAPFTVASTTVVANLNASLLLGNYWGAPGAIGDVTPGSGAFTTLTASGSVTGVGFGVFLKHDGTVALSANWDAGGFEIRAETFESDVATGTAPFVVASTTVVANLNASLLLGGTWAIPGTIGSTTPNTAVFTTVGGTVGTWTGAKTITTGFPCLIIRRAATTVNFAQGVSIRLFRNDGVTYYEYAAITGAITSSGLGVETGRIDFYCASAGTAATSRAAVATLSAAGTLSLLTGAEYQINGTKIGFTTGAIGGVLVTTPAAAHMLLYDSVDSRFENVAMSGDATIASSGALTFATVATAGTYDRVTVNAKGLVTAGTTTPHAGEVVNLYTNVTAVGNVGAGEDDLMSYTVLAAQLTSDKDSLEFEALYFIKGGETTAIRIKFGATTVFAATGLGPAGDEYITIQGRIVRTGATTQISTFWGQCTSALAGFNTLLQRTAPAETLSGTVILKSTGESTVTPANNDVQQLWATVNYKKTI